MSHEHKHYQLKKQVVLQILTENSLKKWWVAEFSGVHKTTLRRWLQGRTRFIHNRNIENLAAILGTSVQTIADPVKLRRGGADKIQ